MSVHIVYISFVLRKNCIIKIKENENGDYMVYLSNKGIIIFIPLKKHILECQMDDKDKIINSFN